MEFSVKKKKTEKSRKELDPQNLNYENRLFYKGVNIFYCQSDAIIHSTSNGGLPIFAWDIPGMVGKKKYYSISYSVIKDLLLNQTTKRHFYEIILHGLPCHFYVDAEIDRIQNPELTEVDIKRINIDFINLVYETMISLGQIKSEDELITKIYDSTTDRKVSRHYIFKFRDLRTAFKDNYHCGALLRHIRQKCLSRTDYHPTGNSLFFKSKKNGKNLLEFFADERVYTMNRCFRTLLSTKSGKTSYLQPMEFSESKKEWEVPKGWDKTSSSIKSAIQSSFVQYINTKYENLNLLTCFNPNGTISVSSSKIEIFEVAHQKKENISSVKVTHPQKKEDTKGPPLQTEVFSLAEIRKFYDTKYPFEEVWKLLGSKEREFSVECKKNNSIYWKRNLFYESSEDFRKSVVSMPVISIHVGPLHRINNQKESIEKELILDIDIDDSVNELKKPLRNCCKSKRSICAKCWPLLILYKNILTYLCKKVIGCDNFKTFYTGGRGIHFWIFDDLMNKQGQSIQNSEKNRLTLVDSVFTYNQMYSPGTYHCKRIYSSIIEPYLNKIDTSKIKDGEECLKELWPPIDTKPIRIDHLVRCPFGLRQGTGFISKEIISEDYTDYLSIYKG